ncbi:MAG: hypothetical protein CVV23_11165 [Ignavibacteriae bacterium HGW-Ignavibacteriae-2]|jgi:hypothetical protein|nr:hypothetical protein [Bacteroidota bacterium]PKL88287.1 MAG: hypothetical protein CVV23_11165 [Ignavibacteriae bacterium HGW-Ignavibacteriae-2]
MKNIEKKDRTKKTEDEKYFKSRLLSLNKNYSSQIQFIVPWVQLEEYGLENNKNLLENRKI